MIIVSSASSQVAVMHGFTAANDTPTIIPNMGSTYF